jgi:hypothetical protein
MTRQSVVLGRRRTGFDINSSRTERVFWRKIQKMNFSPENGWIEKLMVPLESAPQEVSNECWYVFDNHNFAISVSCPWRQKSQSVLKSRGM